jgi:hypothetical protein
MRNPCGMIGRLLLAAVLFLPLFVQTAAAQTRAGTASAKIPAATAPTQTSPTGASAQMPPGAANPATANLGTAGLGTANPATPASAPTVGNTADASPGWGLCQCIADQNNIDFRCPGSAGACQSTCGSKYSFKPDAQCHAANH